MKDNNRIEQTPRGLLLRLKVTLPYGLHSRPAARVAQTAQIYHSDIHIICENSEANAKSMLDLMALAPTANTELAILAAGSDAEKALLSIADVFNTIKV